MEGQVEKERSSVVTGATRREGGACCTRRRREPLHENVLAMRHRAIDGPALSVCLQRTVHTSGNWNCKDRDFRGCRSSNFFRVWRFTRLAVELCNAVISVMILES